MFGLNGLAREAIEDAFQILCNGAQLSMDYFRIIHVKIQGLVAALGPEDFDADVLLGELDGQFGASDNFVDLEEFSWYMEELLTFCGVRVFHAVIAALKRQAIQPLAEAPETSPERAALLREWDAFRAELDADAKETRERFERGFAAAEVLPPLARFQDLAARCSFLTRRWCAARRTDQPAAAPSFYSNSFFANDDEIS